MTESEKWLESKNPKILLCENKSNAMAWIGCLNEKDKKVLGGVKVKTLQELCAEIITVGLVLEKKEKKDAGAVCEVTECDNMTAELIIRQIVKDIITAPGYKGNIKLTSVDSALGREFLRIFNELRLGNRIEGVELNEKEKSQYETVKEVLKRYDDFLITNSLYDSARMVTEAVRYLEKFSDSKTALPQYKQYEFGILTPWDLMPAQQKVIDLFKNLTREGKVVETDIRKQNIDGDNFTFVKAYTFTGEVRNAVEDIRNKNIPLSTVEILCMNRGLADAALMVLASEGIPAYMQGSNNALSNNILGFVYDYCDWVINGCLEDLEYKIKNSNIIYFGDIYDPERTDVTGKQKRSEADARYEDVSEKLRDLGDGKCSVLDLLNKLHQVFEEYSKKIRSIYSQYKPVYEKLSGRYALYEEKLDIAEAALELKNAVSMIRMTTGSDESSLLITVFGDRYVTERDNLYIAGMSDMHFRLSNADSPVLPSSLMKKINTLPEIFFRSAEERKEEYLSDTLRTLRSERIIISCASYDISSEIPKAIPVSLFLSDLMRSLGRKAFDVTKTGFDLPDYNYIRNEDILMSAPPEESDDPSSSGKVAITSSALCRLLSCPREYYYNKVRGIYLTEENEANAARWLNAAQKGLLCHEVLEIYCKRELQEKDNVSPSVNEKVFNSVFDELAYKWKKEVPPASEAICKKEVEEYRETLHGTLNELHVLLNDPPDGHPWKLFGMEYEVGENTEDAYAFYEFDSKKLYFYGTIDRIDHYIDDDGIDHYRMLDYKTGNKNKKIKEIKTGIWPQHIVYSILLDAYLKKAKGEDYKYVLDDFVYLFPFEKKDRLFTVKNETIDGKSDFEFSEDMKKKIIGSIFDGDFSSYEESGKLLKDKAGLTYGRGPECCRYCNYKDICIDRMGNTI